MFAGLCTIGLVVQGQANESRIGERTVLHIKTSLNAGSSVDSFGLSPDGKSLLVRTTDHAIQLWDLSGGLLKATIGGFKRSPGFSWGPDGGRFFTGDRDDGPTIWDGRTGARIFELSGAGSALTSEPYSSWMNSFGQSGSWSPDGSWLVTKHSGKTIAVWNTRAGTLQCRITAPAGSVVRWSPDNNALMILKEDNGLKAQWLMRQKSEIQIWDVAGARQESTIRTEGLLSKAIFTPDGKHILTAGGWVPELWDAATGELHARLKSPSCQFKSYRVTCGEQYAELSPDGRLVAVHSYYSPQIDIWEVASGKPLAAIDTGKGNESSCKGFSPDGKLLAIYQEHFKSTWSFKTESGIALYDTNNGQLKTTLTGSNMMWSAHQLVWSHDGQTLATAGGSKGYEGKIWDLNTGRLISTLQLIAKEGHVPLTATYFNDLDRLSFHPSRPVLIGDSVKFIKFWNATSGDLLQTITKSASRWSNDGQFLVTTPADKQTLQVWELN